MTNPEWSRKAEITTLLWLRVATFLYRLAGKALCELFLYPIAAFYFFFSSESRAASLEYLRHHFPNETKARLYWFSYKHFLEFARALLDKFAVWQGDIKFEGLSFVGKDELRSMVESKKGAVVISAHLGNIEIIRAVSRELKSVTVNALMFTGHNPGFNQMLKSMNPDSMLRVIPTEAPGPELIIDLQERIRNGEIVAMLADRVMPGSPAKNVEVPFLGEIAHFPSGPFILASLLECPVFLILCIREKRGSYRSYFERLSDRLDLDRKERTKRLTRVIELYVSRIEHYCRLYPFQWFNFFRFWSQK